MSPPACGSKPVSAAMNATRSTLLGSAAPAPPDASASSSPQAATSARRTDARLQELCNVGRDGRGLGVRRVALDDLAFAIDQELGEVPLDRFRAEHPGLRFLQVLVKWRGVFSVDVDLREHREGHAVIDLAEALDLL